MIRVLVVDDDKLVRKGLISAMPWSDYGMEVAGEANNGEKALEFMERHPVDLLLTDLAMPVMSGLELMRTVRKRYPHLPIVVLTFHQDFEYVQEALRLGAIDYIAKVQLEKERFDQVLQRVVDQMQGRGIGRDSAVQHSSPRHVARAGWAYAFLSLKHGRNPEGLVLPGGMPPTDSWMEAGGHSWLWWPDEASCSQQEKKAEAETGTATGTEPGMEAGAEERRHPVLQAFRPEAGWGILKLQGIGGMDTKDLLGWLLSYREHEFFYDYDPAGVILHRSPADRPDGPCRGGGQEDNIPALKARWSSREWIHDGALFEELLRGLKELRLPQAKLIGLVYALIDDWNRLGGPLGFERIEPEGPLDYWCEVEALFRQARHIIRRSVGNTSYSKEVTDAVMKAVSLIRGEPEQPLTAAVVARRVGMSRSYFSQCFRDITGQTFNDHVRHIRMERAKELLICTNRTIAWIAEQTGYTDEKYFSRTFREHTGVLPSEYRNAHQQR